MKWKIRFFQTARGDYPVKNFTEEQERSTFAKIIHSIELLETHGPFLKPPYSKKIRQNLYELRIPGKITIRVLYTAYKNQFFLLHAFKKKTQKTPPKEIKTALDRMKVLI